MDVREFADLKAKAERAERDAARAAGVAEELAKQLREQFQCESLPESDAKSAAMTEKLAELDDRYAALREQSEREYPDFWRGV